MAESVVGQDEADAVRVIEGYGYTWRVAARDGENFALTTDYYDGRINIAIENGMVVSADVG